MRLVIPGLQHFMSCQVAIQFIDENLSFFLCFLIKLFAHKPSHTKCVFAEFMKIYCAK